MKRKKPEIIPGDKRAARRWLFLGALYLLLMVLLEPLIDFFLMQQLLDYSDEAIIALNREKQHFAAIAFGIARSLPIMLFLWFGWQVMAGMRLPPRGIRLPFTVTVITGPNARMMGMMIVALALLLLFRELSMLLAA